MLPLKYVAEAAFRPNGLYRHFTGSSSVYILGPVATNSLLNVGVV